MGRRLALALPFLVALACSKYGDEDEVPLPARNGASSGTASSGGEGGGGNVDPATPGGTSGTAPGVDGGLPDGGPATAHFCSTVKDALRCLDFDSRPAHPFGFDIFLGGNDAAKLTDARNGNSALRISSTAGGVFNSLPQDTKALSLSFDMTIESITGTPTIVGVIGAGSSCAPAAGSVGLVASTASGNARFSITNLPPALGDAPFNTPLHITLRSEPAPGPGRTINGLMTVEFGATKLSRTWSAALPAGCTSFTGAIGGAGALTSSAAVATIDNVLMTSK